MKNIIFACFLFISLAAKAQDNDTTIVDIRKSTFGHKSTMPSFKGTAAEYGAFITNNFHHPLPERENGIGGRVVLLCLFEKDGSISRITVDSSVTKNIDAEAIRVVRLMPKFTIGTFDGKPARYLVDLHLAFYYNPRPPMTLAEKAMASYLPMPAMKYATVANESFADTGKFEIDLSVENKDFKKSANYVWLSIGTNLMKELPDGVYAYSDKSASERGTFKFLGSVKAGAEVVDIADGSFTIKSDKKNINIAYSLTLKNGARITGRYNGNYKAEDRTHNKP